MATRVISPARQAWRKGIIPFLKFAWDKEPVIVVSCVLGSTLPLTYLLFPRSYWEKVAAENRAIPNKYPTPIRYVEGKTGEPTTV
ncbi:NADH dehydrogenase [ubiquinone] 1 alpha subcomplex subunit 3-like [Diadema setosum]|uniref:NADH dehydrogenase [ubiquinone] 1 alpha subcomplex subunit 3-like n=1 Tax=Diadema setosum TaxID=31175 RepID=UPI003B3A1204